MLILLKRNVRRMENIGFVEKIKGFIFSPTETFKKLKEEALGDSLRYFVILLFIFNKQQ